MSFVKAGELKDYMSGIGLDADQLDAAQTIIDGLQRQLERYCQRPLERKERTETLYPDENGRIWPTATPIVSVSAPLDVWIIGNYVSGLPSAFGLITAPVVVTYIGGVDGDVEEDIRAAILRAAAREMTVRHDDVLDVSDLSARQVQPVDRKPPGFQPDELAQFDRLRRRTVV
jgi:hypothetical protein